MKTVQQAIYQQLLTRLGEGKPQPRLKPVQRLAALAGSPQLDFRVIQVAGTNGKTSTARIIESFLRTLGLRTGLFTSPHLTDFTERIAVDGEPVNSEALAEAWQQLELPLTVCDKELQDAGEQSITFFEALAVLAFLVYSDAPVQVAVIEVGMGGQWDATNIATAEIAVFTPIALDHTEILGPDLAAIARTKAGIIKTGTKTVTAAQELPALEQLAAAAKNADAAAGETSTRQATKTEAGGCPREEVFFKLYGPDFSLKTDELAVGGRLVGVHGIYGEDYEPQLVGLFGEHQAQNVALGLAAVEAFLEGSLSREVYEGALAQVSSPGRLQVLGQDPAVLIDAAHNPHGAAALTKAVTESFAFKELALVVGALQDKDAAGVFEHLADLAARVWVTPVASERTASRELLLSTARAAFTEVQVLAADDLGAALTAARGWAGQGSDRAVLVTGSVLLVGQALKCAREEGWSLI